MQLTNSIVLFDGVCNFCNRMVNFAIRNDRKGKLKFAPLQSEAGKELIKKFNVSPTADTIVFIEKAHLADGQGIAYTYARASIRICKYLDWPAKILYAFIIIPSFISQPFYKWIARNRYKWFGKKEKCMVPTQQVKDRFLD